jgi:RNA polymerase sigma-70 factor (ECF subfamily)
MENSEVLILIRRSLAGDESAFAALFHQYKNLVYKTAFVMLGSPDEADDVLQEVFLEVHRSLSSYQASKGMFSTWLYRITVNDCLSWRRKRRFLFVSLEECVPEPRDEAGRAHEGQAEIADDVLKAMSHLSVKLRAVVALRYYRDLSYAEIATILNVPIGTVKSRLFEALTLLRKHLSVSATEAVAGNLLPSVGGMSGGNANAEVHP